MFRRRTIPAEESGQDMLAFLGATVHPLPQGFYVYALHELNGTVFRVGQSDHLLSRLRDHHYTYGERFHHYSLLHARDEHQADLFEAMLVDYYQPLENKAGTAEVEALRRRIRQSKGGSGLRGYREAAG
jgi:hypothetical protein